MIDVTKEIKLLIGGNKGKFPYCNSLYIDDEIKGLIDTGCGQEALGEIESNVDAVILSHYHFDHISGNSHFKDKPIYCHPADIPPVENKEAILNYTGIIEIGEKESNAFLNFLNYQPAKVSGSFTGGDELDFGKTKLKVIHTPGHSPGHCCFYEEKEGILFSADIDLSSFGPWYGHNSCEIDAFEDSIKKIMHISPKTVISGHNGIVTKNVNDSLICYMAKIRQRDKLILDFCSEPRTIDDIVDHKFIYGKHPEPGATMFRHFEKKMIKKHLDRLFTRGELKIDGILYSKVKKFGNIFLV